MFPQVLNTYAKLSVISLNNANYWHRQNGKQCLDFTKFSIFPKVSPDIKWIGSGSANEELKSIH